LPALASLLRWTPTGLAGPLSGAGVGARALATNRQATTMADAAIAIDRLKALEILLQLASQIAFNDVLVFRDHLDDPVELLIGQALGANIGADFSLFEDQLGPGRPNAVNVGESGFNPFVTGNIDTEEARHILKV